jgi:hypothetical protein
MGPYRSTGVLALCYPVTVDLEIRTQVPTHEGPLRGCSLLDSLRKGRFPFFMPSPTAKSGLKPSDITSPGRTVGCCEIIAENYPLTDGRIGL